ncbi:E3 SUMO-protein ligase pli1 [Histomonas meleagridis]|uniref:E3 SUMO-protein ligase pli1 n=1 Tax=Histomonas meleagridis TaxID=135588 RepID=UPI00355A6D7A|nr:E3 SUMO-protein ligase pli1 [Histomonas meleagridis]KAH0800647.1 E3 SUMO-protein ligase pli1 [Histomonas meleagridis]
MQDDDEPIIVSSKGGNFSGPFSILQHFSGLSHRSELIDFDSLTEQEKELFDPEKLSCFYIKPHISEELIFGPLQMWNDSDQYSGTFNVSQSVRRIMQSNKYIVPVAFCITKDSYLWPLHFSITLNGVRYDRPEFNINPESQGYWLNLSSSFSFSSNQIQVYADSNVSQKFIIVIRLFCAPTDLDLAKKVLTHPHTDLDHWKELFKIYKSENEDAVVSNTFVLSLNCPIGLWKITDPCRSINCSHLLCFDLMTFLRYARSYGQWKCPICGKECTLDELQIDDFVQQIINTLPEKCESAFVNENGDYKVDKIVNDDVIEESD